MRFPGMYTVKFCCVLLLVLALAGCSNETANNETANTESESSTLPTGERISVTEDEIVDAMQKDDLDRFLGKQLELKGVVGALGADGGGNLILEQVRLNMLEPEPWKIVMPGQEVVLLGTYTEERGLKFAVESVTGERLVMEAPELAKEFVADKEAANTNYKDQSIELHGSVIESKTGDGDIQMIRLQADEDNFVLCNFFPSGQEAEVKQVKVGDQIKLVGRYTNQSSFDSPLLNDCLLITK